MVVVVFLANHCPVVQAYEDRLIDFTKDYKDKGVKVVGIAVSRWTSDKLPGIKDYMKDNKSNYIYGYDESQAVGQAYGATRTPQFFVLDKERKIRYTGAMDDSQRGVEGQQDLPPRRGRRRSEGRNSRGRRDPRRRLWRIVQQAARRFVATSRDGSLWTERIPRVGGVGSDPDAADRQMRPPFPVLRRIL